MTELKRNSYFDTTKFILIFLVVFGHFFGEQDGTFAYMQ